MKETYKVKTPKKIIFGDPWYFEQYSGEELQRLVVDLNPPKRFAARVVLEEEPCEEYLDMMLRSMTIYLAPEQTMDTYLKNMMYTSQTETVKSIGVDTAKYYLQIDEKDDTIGTGGDGYWGEQREYSREIGGRRVLDAAVITVCMSEFETMESMRSWLGYFFQDVEQTENAVIPDTAESDTQSENDEPQQNM